MDNIISKQQIESTLKDAISKLEEIEMCVKRLDKYGKFLLDLLHFYCDELEEIQYTIDDMQAKLQKQSYKCKDDPQTRIMNYVVAGRMREVASNLNDNTLYDYIDKVELDQIIEPTEYSLSSDIEILRNAIEASKTEFETTNEK